MPFAAPASDASGDFEQLISQAGFGQVLYPPAAFPVPLPASIAASGNWNSGLMFNDGYRIIAIGVTSSQAGTIVVAPFLDLAGTIARPTISTAIVAATPLIVDIPATPTSTSPGPYYPPFSSFTIQINNSGGSPATVSAFQVILSAG